MTDIRIPDTEPLDSEGSKPALDGATEAFWTQEDGDRLKIVIETVGDPIFVKDNEHRFVLANPAFYKLLDLKPSAVLGKTLAEHLSESEMKHFLAVDRKVLDTGAQDLREEPLTVGGVTRTIVTRKSRFVDRFGNKFLVGAIHDVTDLERALQEQKDATGLLRESQMIARLGSYALDIATGSWTSSEALDAVFGIDATYDRTVKGWEALIHPDDRAEMSAYFNREIVGRRKPFNKEYRIVRHDDGVVRWVHGLGELKTDHMGRLLVMRGTIQDLTEKIETTKELELARVAATNVLQDLQTEKQKLDVAVAKDEAILAAIGDGLVATDADGGIVLTNRAFASMTGWEQKDVIGRRLIDIIPLTDDVGERVVEDKRVISSILSGSASSAMSDTTRFLVRKNGSRFPVALMVTPIWSAGAIVGAVEVLRDVTKERELDRAKSEFISIASHQLRTPVSALRWLTEALQHYSTGLTSKQLKYLDDLAHATRRLVDLVEGLLDVSRIQMNSPILLERTSVNIASFIDESVREMEPYAESHRHTLVCRNQVPNSFTMEANRKSLYNIMQNLISNAIDYSPERTSVTIVSELTDHVLKVSVINGGPHIPKEEQRHMFERFYRGDAARKLKTEGTGLGLYISKLLVEEMSGTLGFTSDEGKDTVFWFTLPLTLTQ